MALLPSHPPEGKSKGAAASRTSAPPTEVSELGTSGRGHGFERVLGDFQGDSAGPSVVFVGGIHGNEPAGALACARLAPILERLRGEIVGRVVLLAGNRQALAAGLRFVHRDLNRGWSAARLERLAARTARELGDEDREQLAIWQVIEKLERARRGPLVTVDLHTTSGPSAPFVCFGDTLANRQLAECLPATAILGLEEVIDGAFAGFFTDRGHIGIAVEAGQHSDPTSIDRHLAAMCLVLVESGCLKADHLPELAAGRRRLEAAAAGQPRVVEVRHRHVVSADDEFEMLPGLSSFLPIARGQIVARDRNGPVRSPESGLMLMPRYQSQGEDGYFLVRPVPPAWLKISALLRRAGADRVLPLLPGVRRHPALPDALVVNPAIARSQVANVMHLCGYRRRRSVEQHPVFSRRIEGTVVRSTRVRAY